ncbi:NAD-dependent epimerase/dehydratase family protein [Patescibacteria group bacterium]
MNKVLVTGGTGFIGSHLVETLLKQNRKVRVLALRSPSNPIELENEEILRKKGCEIVYGDLLDKESLVAAVEDVDTVFHLAGISRPMKIGPRQYYGANVVGTKNLLESIRAKSIKRFVHVSTVSVLGVSPNGHPLREDEFQYESMYYAQSKREGEYVALQYFYEYKIPVVVIRPCLVYGPRCLVRLIMFKYVKLGLFPLFNDGQALMEFAYVDNVVNSLLLAEQKENILGEVFNITDGRPYKIGTVLKIIATQLGVRAPFIKISVPVGKFLGYVSEIISTFLGIYPPFSSTAADWMSRDVNVYDCTKAKKVLGYKPKVSLEEGIKKSIEWYKSKKLL